MNIIEALQSLLSMADSIEKDENQEKSIKIIKDMLGDNPSNFDFSAFITDEDDRRYGDGSASYTARGKSATESLNKLNAMTGTIKTGDMDKAVLGGLYEGTRGELVRTVELIFYEVL